ncbi:unnamed protein product [Triticum turgidum subsp. durum]|uniref:Uncharacterized protein n=1 Tax=Triticum turgidum subsp. durum TaxID=4567 RepID=A0A9R1PQJ4_TRITD|nr:unnamed protein product [Triticum turgidum subsp. durum]
MRPAVSPGGGRRMPPGEEALRSLKRPRHPVDPGSGSDPGSSSGSESDGDFVSDLRQIACLLRLIKGGPNKDRQKMCEQIIASVAANIQTMLEDTKSKFEKERQNLLKVLSGTSKECESSLNEEYTKLQETYEMFCEENDAHLQTFKDLFSQVEVEKKKLLEQYQYQRKETATLSELGETFSEKITNAKPSPKRMKQDDKSFIIFRKSIGSYLECASDDDFDLDDE